MGPRLTFRLHDVTRAAEANEFVEEQPEHQRLLALREETDRHVDTISFVTEEDYNPDSLLVETKTGGGKIKLGLPPEHSTEILELWTALFDKLHDEFDIEVYPLRNLTECYFSEDQLATVIDNGDAHPSLRRSGRVDLAAEMKAEAQVPEEKLTQLERLFLHPEQITDEIGPALGNYSIDGLTGADRVVSLTERAIVFGATEKFGDGQTPYARDPEYHERVLNSDAVESTEGTVTYQTSERPRATLDLPKQVTLEERVEFPRDPIRSVDALNGELCRLVGATLSVED